VGGPQSSPPSLLHCEIATFCSVPPIRRWYCAAAVPSSSCVSTFVCVGPPAPQQIFRCACSQRGTQPPPGGYLSAKIHHRKSVTKTQKSPCRSVALPLTAMSKKSSSHRPDEEVEEAHRMMRGLITSEEDPRREREEKRTKKRVTTTEIPFKFLVTGHSTRLQVSTPATDPEDTAPLQHPFPPISIAQPAPPNHRVLSLPFFSTPPLHPPPPSRHAQRRPPQPPPQPAAPQCNQSQSAAPECNQSQSAAPECNQPQPAAPECNQSAAPECNQPQQAPTPYVGSRTTDHAASDVRA
jgi:hypothetical protein